MRPSTLVYSLLSLVSIPTSAAASEENHLAKRISSDSKDSSSLSTTFNGAEVPPMRELTPDNFKDLTKEGYWFIKHYSPACTHCRKIAPAWQTLYEFYYVSWRDFFGALEDWLCLIDYQTSDPLSSSSTKSPDPQSLNSFQKFYDFHFASMNCLAYADFCTELEIDYYPLFTLYHNGQLMGRYEGEKNIDGLGGFVEEKLELIRPGSRPPKGIKLPRPGDKNVNTKAEPDVPAAKDKNPEGGIKAAEKHNEQVAHEEKKTNNKPKPKSVPANPQGLSVPLTAENFQKLVTTTQDPWFIKFYAPWCGHCQALAPTWSQMAKEMQHVLNVGEVNCDAEPRLCKDARVNAFPTMYFFRGGERVEYNGLRGLGDLINYAKKAVDVGSGVQDVDAVAFKELEEKEEVLFLYFYDHATTSEDFQALDRLTLSLVGHARLVKTNSAALAERFKISTWPRLLVVRDGRPSYYNVLAPKDMRDFRQLLNWMRTVWLPIVPEMTASNAREIMTGKYVVLGVLSRRRSDDFILAKRELKNAALEWMDKQTQLFQLERKELRDTKQLRIEEADDREDQRALRAAKNMRITIREDDKKQVGFAWVDGDFWERWLRTTYGIDVENGERVIINDEDNRRYWDTSSSGASIMASRTSILETIPLVIANPSKLTPKSTVGTLEGAFFSSRSFISSHPIIFVIMLIIFIAAVTFVARGRVSKRVARGGILGATGNSGTGFFQLEGKDSFLNGGTTGKVD